MLRISNIYSNTSLILILKCIKIIIKQNLFLIILTFLATLSMAASAMHLYWTSPTMSTLQSEDSPIGRPITDEEGSWVVSLIKLGEVPSAIIAGWLVEVIGRKKTLLIGGVSLAIPWFMILFGKKLIILYLARFIAGCGTGIIIMTCTIYNAEIAENDIRGKLGTSLVALKLVGSLLVLSIGPYVSYNNIAIISVILPVVFCFVFIFSPESPYYLMKIGDRDGAEKNLKSLSSKAVSDGFISKRLAEIETCVHEDMQNKTTVWEFLSNKQYRNAIIIMIGVKTIQQFSGQAAIDTYMQTIIDLTGSSLSSNASSIIFGFIQLPSVLLSSYLVEKIGRKPLFIFTCCGSAIAMFGEGTYFYLQDITEADLSSIGWLPTTALTLFLVMNSLGIYTLTYVILSELFPTNIKGIAVAAFTFYGGLLAFLVSKYFKPLSNTLGTYTMFWFFGSCCVLGAFFILAFLPETKGKSFSEVQDILNRRRRKDDCEKKSSKI